MPSVLFVCTANQCRSVIAEHLLRSRLTAVGLDWTVTSAGTHARAGTSPPADTREVLAGHGVVVDPEFRSRPVTVQLVAAADLVLTATHQHQHDVLLQNPRAARRSFPLLQFARLVSAGSPPEHDRVREPAELLRLAAHGRLSVQPRAKDLDDVTDPIGGTAVAYRTCTEVIDTALTTIFGPLADAAPAPAEVVGADERINRGGRRSSTAR